jgi:hypothetical protein
VAFTTALADIAVVVVVVVAVVVAAVVVRIVVVGVAVAVIAVVGLAVRHRGGGVVVVQVGEDRRARRVVVEHRVVAGAVALRDPDDEVGVLIGVVVAQYRGSLIGGVGQVALAGAQVDTGRKSGVVDVLGVLAVVVVAVDAHHGLRTGDELHRPAAVAAVVGLDPSDGGDEWPVQRHSWRRPARARETSAGRRAQRRSGCRWRTDRYAWCVPPVGPDARHSRVRPYPNNATGRPRLRGFT